MFFFLFNRKRGRERNTNIQAHTHLSIYWFMYTWFLGGKNEKKMISIEIKKKKEIEVDNNPVEKLTWRLMVVKDLINVINITIYSWLNICTNTENISKMTQIYKILISVW